MKKTIWTNGCFDIIHSGHVESLRYAKSLGDYLIVGIDSDSRVKAAKGQDRPYNNLADRMLVLNAIKYVDEIRVYSTEAELRDMLCEIWPNVRILGSDYITKDNFTGCNYDIPIYYHERNHNYSSSNLRKKILKNA